MELYGRSREKDTNSTRTYGPTERYSSAVVPLATACVDDKSWRVRLNAAQHLHNWQEICPKVTRRLPSFHSVVVVALVVTADSALVV